MLEVIHKNTNPKSKKISLAALSLAVATASIFSFGAFGVGAVKPADNLAGAQKVSWNLSGDVMPVPPYGSLDIIGSDTASSLIVNRPQGNNQLALTGTMKGLSPNATYTVYLSNGYDPFVQSNVVGSWVWDVLGTYHHDITITSQDADGDFEGYGCYPAGTPLSECGPGYPGTTTEVITGHISGVGQISMTTVYDGPVNPGYTATATGTINADGSITGSSPWSWSVDPGSVTPASGSTGWPGLFPGQTPFTFTTNEQGIGSWHVNLKAADLPTGESIMSVWINGSGKTILISNPFIVAN